MKEFKDWVKLSGSVSFKVGDRNRIMFWHHKWCGDNTLKDDFPNTYRVSCQKELSIQQIQKIQGGEVFWGLGFKRSFHNWEVIEFQRLLDMLHKQCRSLDSHES